MRLQILLTVIFTLGLCQISQAHDLVKRVKQAKQSVVGIGIYDPLGSPRAALHGSGFVIGDGTLIATNYHVVEKPLSEESKQHRAVFVGQGSMPETLLAKVVKIDALHDLAILKVDKKLKPFALASDAPIPDGTEVAFTGFPIGAILGLYPATHKGIISAYTPIIIPSDSSRRLDAKALKRLRDPYFVYQMDATAYPGNSGSAVYSLDSGKVVAIINKVFVKQTKESVLSAPSGITYAIPVRYLRSLLAEVK